MTFEKNYPLEDLQGKKRSFLVKYKFRKSKNKQTTKKN